MTYPFDCPICKIKKTPPENPKAQVNCPAYRAPVCMEHCEECKYHSTRCSIEWCIYRTVEDKKNEREAKNRWLVR